ncbi:MAG: TetR/AcrR family transcriptional regulator [Acidimicrobiia bacterium]|nr:TetR/AcrR family transcriptional regulator [Acidimicrobiia bacterium]
MGKVKTQHAEPRSRKEKAAATRRRIIDAATRLFSENGYAGTTMQAIADHADVAVQTVYFVFHTKGELLRQLLLDAGGRPDEPTETMERDWVDEALTDPDSRRTIALMVEHGNDIYSRIAPVWAAIGQGASVEPEVAAQWDHIVEQRRLGIRRMVESIADRGHLRHGLTVDRAADIIFGLQRPETLTVFVVERNWPLVEYKTWSYDTLCQQLIDTVATDSSESSPTRGLSFDQRRTRDTHN